MQMPATATLLTKTLLWKLRIKKYKIKAMEKYKAINEAVKNGDFTEFDKLNATDQIKIMKTWDAEMQIK